MENKWNPRYVCYARSQGRFPENQMENDREEFPGGVMTGFMLWINKQKQAFYKAFPQFFLDRHRIANQDAFTKYLETISKK